MSEKQGEEVISLLKEILIKLNNIEEVSESNRDINQEILFKLDNSVII